MATEVSAALQSETSAIDARIAARVRERRIELGWSLARLAAASGVSKAMIAKIESARSSPTAGVLGRLCGGLGITMSGLMASVETEDAVLVRGKDQARWRDPATGLERTAVSPLTAYGVVDVARLRLPAGTVVDYPNAPLVPFAQHILGVQGRLLFTLGARQFRIGPGDCVAARIDRPTRFEAPAGPVVYLVIIERTSARRPS